MASCIVVFATFAATPARTDCKCLANGRIFHHGEIACLQLPSGPELARCGMVLNNSSWKKIQDGCPEATVALVSLLDRLSSRELKDPAAAPAGKQGIF